METALEAASLHPAQLLGIEDRKGTLDYDSDAGICATGLGGQQCPSKQEMCNGGHAARAVCVPLPVSVTSFPASAPDFLLLDDSLHVRATYIAGQQVWRHTPPL